jgi:hypothetical protein
MNRHTVLVKFPPVACEKRKLLGLSRVQADKKKEYLTAAVDDRVCPRVENQSHLSRAELVDVAIDLAGHNL